MSIGTAVTDSRILFAMSRDGCTSLPMGRLSKRTGAPAGALAIAMAVALGVMIAQRLVGTSAVNAFFYPARSASSACWSPTS